MESPLLEQKQAYQKPANSTIAIQEWVNCFKLIVHEPTLH